MLITILAVLGTAHAEPKLKPIPLVAPKSTYRKQADPILEFEKSESEIDDIKMKKLKPIDVKKKEAPEPEPQKK